MVTALHGNSPACHSQNTARLCPIHARGLIKSSCSLGAQLHSLVILLERRLKVLLLEWRRARGSGVVPIASLSLGSTPQLSSEAAALPVLALCSATLCGLETFLPPLWRGAFRRECCLLPKPRGSAQGRIWGG